MARSEAFIWLDGTRLVQWKVSQWVSKLQGSTLTLKVVARLATRQQLLGTETGGTVAIFIF